MTRRLRFDRFTSVLSPDGAGRPADPEMIESFREDVPVELVEFWTKHGLGSFGGGALWFFDPREIIEETRRYEGAERGIPFARSAFADFWFLLGDSVHFTLVQPNMTSRASPRLDLWGSDYFDSQPDTASILKSDLLRQAKEALGPIGHDECYGLKQAMALGGEEVVENMRIHKLVVYLDVLASIHGGTS